MKCGSLANDNGDQAPRKVNPTPDAGLGMKGQGSLLARHASFVHR